LEPCGWAVGSKKEGGLTMNDPLFIASKEEAEKAVKTGGSDLAIEAWAQRYIYEHSYQYIPTEKELREMAHCMKDLIAGAFHLFKPGNLVCAILANDLQGAFQCADAINTHWMGIYPEFLHHCLPAPIVQAAREEERFK